MDKLKYRYIILLSLFIGILFSSCKDKWAEHDTIADPILTVNLMAQINKNPELSTFSSYLVKTGYDKVVASSKTFTIWAPTNTALQTLDPAIVSDSAKLRQFVGNFIANQSYFTYNPNPVLTIRTLNGKNILFTKTKFEEANIVTADRYVGNGVLHTIDLAILPKLNAWEYLYNSTASLQKTFLQSLDYTYFDVTRAVVTGVDPVTGVDLYKPGSGDVIRNYYRQRTQDLINEDGKFTFIILSDAAFNAEKVKMSKYYLINDIALTPARQLFVADSLTNWNIVKDLVFKGDFANNLPDSLVSNDSVKVHIAPGDILETHKVSNGVVYVVNKINYRMQTKIKPIIIKGTNYYANYGSYGTRTTTFTRDPNTLLDFTQIYYYNHGKASYWIQYMPRVNSVTYKVYWRAVRTFDLTAVSPLVPVMFSQRLAFYTTALMPTFPYKQVDLLNYNELYLNDLPSTGYGILTTYLVGATTTVNGTNSLVLDYIKMVPILN